MPKKEEEVKGVKKESPGWFRRNKILIMVLGVFLALFLAVFGTQIWLWINFWLGNDVIISLSADHEYLSLSNGEEGEINFEVRVSTNPFCSVECISTFADVSNNRELDRNDFTLRPEYPFRKGYTLTPVSPGSGEELYQFKFSCKGVSTALCHTSEEITTRSVLITLTHNLNAEEQVLKENQKAHLFFAAKQLTEFEQEYLLLTELVSKLNESLLLESYVNSKESINQSTTSLRELLKDAQRIWGTQDYRLLSEHLSTLDWVTQETDHKFEEWNQSVLTLFNDYNQLIFRVSEAAKSVERFQNNSVLSSSFVMALNTTAINFDQKLDEFSRKNDILRKEQVVSEMERYVSGVDASIRNEIKSGVMENELSLNRDKDVLCAIGEACVKHSLITDLAYQNLFDLNHSCKDRENLKLLLLTLNSSLPIANDSYYQGKEFQDTVNKVITYRQNNVIKSYLTQLSSVPHNASNYGLIADLLGAKLAANVSPVNYDYNFSLPLVQELMKRQPEACRFVPVKLDVSANNQSRITIPIIKDYTSAFNFSLDEPLPKCCVYGRCQNCCLTESCRAAPRNYPILFLHGHAFDKDVSTEYSLDAFTKIQEKLEHDGYLNGGTVSAYSLTDSKQLWKSLPAPLTFRASYYYDFFAS
ncbi:hypothetical protein HZC32_01780, partial [Candidatus Woesearchaeota archaeon]|nr:hypothetical protein [Candidatus Woesearchaeota archaeon]